MSRSSGLGGFVLALAAVVLIGGGLFAAFLPFRYPVAGPDEFASDDLAVTCDPAAWSAWGQAADPAAGGWFAYEPGTAQVLSADGFCVHKARTRVSWAGVAVVVGAGLAWRARGRTFTT